MKAKVYLKNLDYEKGVALITEKLSQIKGINSFKIDNTTKILQFECHTHNAYEGIRMAIIGMGFLFNPLPL